MQPAAVDVGSFTSLAERNEGDVDSDVVGIDAPPDAVAVTSSRPRLPRPPPISPKIIVRSCQSVTPESSNENLHLVTSSSGRKKSGIAAAASSSSMEDLHLMTSSTEDEKSISREENLRPMTSLKRPEPRSSSENSRQADRRPATRTQPVRRKDLCKLLGLNDDTEVKDLPDRKLAQKVALLHTTAATTTTTTAAAATPSAAAAALKEEDNATVKDLPNEAGKRKNLAKFLGVDNLETSESVSGSGVDRDGSKERRNFGKESLSR